MLFITKFNRMIRNKWIWGAFALIVAVFFVGSSVKGGGCTKQSAETCGRLYGEDITFREFRLARFFELGMRDSASLSPENATILRKYTWKRLAALRTAEKIGISASDEEVREAIRRDPAFAVDGVFNKNRYKAVVRTYLHVKDAERIYESYQRQELMLRKLVTMLESVTWTSPLELTQKLNNFTDSFIVEYTTLKYDDHVEGVKVTTEEAETFFNENKELFMIPEKVRVRYVTFPITNYFAEVHVNDADILDYYSDHIEEFSTADTNGVSLPIPLEDVREDIMLKVERESATFKAKDAATEFVIALAPDRYSNAPTMEEAAEDRDLTIATSEFFTITGDVLNMNVDYAFNRAAFGLDSSDPERYFSDAIVGEDAVYVIAASDRHEARDPDFSEVSDLVIPLARRNAEYTAFVEKSHEIRDSVKKAVESGKTFTEAIKDFHLNVVTTESFTVYGGVSSNELEYSEVLISNIVSMAKGDLTDVLETEDGALLAYVAEREPGDAVSMQLLRPQLLAILDRYRAGILFVEWCDYVLAKADFEDLRPVIREEEDQTAENPPSPRRQAQGSGEASNGQ